MVGIIEKDPIPDLLAEKMTKIFLIGPPTGFLAGSEYHRIFGGNSEPICVNFDDELKSNTFIQKAHDFVLSATDVGRGGLIGTLAKWSISSNVGIKVISTDDDTSLCWGEFGSRYLIQVSEGMENQIIKLAEEINVEITLVGSTIKSNQFIFDQSWELEYLRDIWTKPLLEVMQS
ncbi:MAG: AIR synthase-related protein [Candidatus Kariarchaeaceae archaeon]|jgi:phosphoribosylformylglycinamidine (FGAM) synthase-like enzyme